MTEKPSNPPSKPTTAPAKSVQSSPVPQKPAQSSPMIKVDQPVRTPPTRTSDRIAKIILPGDVKGAFDGKPDQSEFQTKGQAASNTPRQE